MERTDELGQVGPLGSEPGPAPEGSGVQKKVHEIAQRFNIAGTAKESSGPEAEKVHLPVSSAPPSSMEQRQVFESIELVQLVSLAEWLKKGEGFTRQHGVLEGGGAAPIFDRSVDGCGEVPKTCASVFDCPCSSIQERKVS